ncbi:MAG TPA: YceI family protein [Gemmatimonadales bacterium]|nr:YceI family protein [Gemmatimonadales bacterium]
MPRIVVSLLFAGILAAPACLTAQTPAPATRLEVAATGNEARYRVREQLAGVDFPNDAIGVTHAVTGQIVLGPDGRVQAAESRITIDLRPLKSDKDRRDGYVQRRLLETDTYPTATLAVTAIRGLPSPLPATGTFSATIEGQLTIRGVTRPTTWAAEVTATPTGFTGTTKTSFTFDQFAMTKPRVAVVLSVEDTIALEYDFTLVRK